MLNGRLHEGGTLAEIHPTPRELPAMWWHSLDPVGVPGVRGMPGWGGAGLSRLPLGEIHGQDNLVAGALGRSAA